MYRAKAIVKHDRYDTHNFYADKEFDTEQEATAWISSMDGFLFANEVMVGIDVMEYLEGYHLEGIEAEKIEA